ncbi:hypothetical protein INR49_020037, partial [Caranx melampygus]
MVQLGRTYLRTKHVQLRCSCTQKTIPALQQQSLVQAQHAAKVQPVPPPAALTSCPQLLSCCSLMLEEYSPIDKVSPDTISSSGSSQHSARHLTQPCHARMVTWETSNRMNTLGGGFKVPGVVPCSIMASLLSFGTTLRNIHPSLCVKVVVTLFQGAVVQGELGICHVSPLRRAIPVGSSHVCRMSYDSLSAMQGSVTQRGQHSPSATAVYSHISTGQTRGQQSTSPSCSGEDRDHAAALLAAVQPGRSAAVECASTLVQTLAAGPVVTAGTTEQILVWVAAVTGSPPAVRLSVLHRRVVGW